MTAKARALTRILGYRAVQVDSFIRLHFAEHGREPSFPEICAGVGINSESEVSRIVNSLVRRGLISRRSGYSRKVRRIAIGAGNANR